MDRKTVLFRYITAATPLETKYFIKIIYGQLRFGISFKTLLDVFLS